MNDLCRLERPAIFDEMIGQGPVVENLRSQAKRGTFFPCYILEGQFGSGKTTMARILSRAVNCEHPDENGNPCGCCPACVSIAKGTPDVIEMDAASNTGIDAIRGLKESVSYLPTSVKKKVYIIDEVHKLSDGAFNALLKVLEEPPAHVVFILCTTEMKKIPATIRSRAACYHFAQISEDDIVGQLEKLSKKHRYDATDEGMHLIAANASGSMRNALKLLEQAVQMDGGASVENVRMMLGLTDPADLFEIAEEVLSGQIPKAIPAVRQRLEKGANPLAMVLDLLDIFSDAVVHAMTGGIGNRNTAHYRNLLTSLCKTADEDRICGAVNGLLKVYQDLQKSADATTLICGLIAMNGSQDEVAAALKRRIELLEESVADMTQSGIPKSVPVMADHVVAAEEPKEENLIVQEACQDLAVEKETTGLAEDGADADGTGNFAAASVEEAQKESDLQESDEPETPDTTDADPFLLLGMFGFSNAYDGQEAAEATDSAEQQAVPESRVCDTADVGEEKSSAKTSASEEVPITDDAGWMFYTDAGTPVRGANPDGNPPESGKPGEEIPFFEEAPTAAGVEEAQEVHTPDGHAGDESTAVDKTAGIGSKEDYLPPNAKGNLNDFLSALYEEQPVMESVLELGFTRTQTEKGIYEFTTNLEAMYRMAKACREVKPFPFAIRKVGV